MRFLGDGGLVEGVNVWVYLDESLGLCVLFLRISLDPLMERLNSLDRRCLISRCSL